MPLVPFRGLLVGVADPKESALTEGASKELEPHGEFLTIAV